MKLLISACLLGENCKYNGKNNEHAVIRESGRVHEVLAVCPEVMGGLPVPRPPAEIREGRVINTEGDDVTKYFVEGTEVALEYAAGFDPDYVILQSRSPSCGVCEVYDGTFTGKRIPGQGVFAAAATEVGYAVIDAEYLTDATPEGLRAAWEKTLAATEGRLPRKVRDKE